MYTIVIKNKLIIIGLTMTQFKYMQLWVGSKHHKLNYLYRDVSINNYFELIFF